METLEKMKILELASEEEAEEVEEGVEEEETVLVEDGA